MGCKILKGPQLLSIWGSKNFYELWAANINGSTSFQDSWAANIYGLETYELWLQDSACKLMNYGLQILMGLQIYELWDGNINGPAS